MTSKQTVFYGSYWACKQPMDCAMIAMIGDDPEDYMVRSCVKWLLKQGVNVLTMSPAKKDYGHLDLVPAMCALDYTMSEVGGASHFVRECTLADGDAYCDCGYKKREEN